MILRSTLVSDFKSCPAKACYKYELGLSAITQGKVRNDLVFGQVIHSAIQTFHEEGMDSALTYIDDFQMDETRRKNKQTAKALLRSYVKNNTVSIECLEKNFQFKIGTHVWKGRFDGIGSYMGKRWVIEHKTTNPFYLILKPNDQFIAYWLGALIFYHDIEGVLINNLDCDKLEVNKFFVHFSQEEKEEWIDEMKMTAETYKRFKTKGIFPRNQSSCYAYNRLCSYISICSSSEGVRPNIIKRCYKQDDRMINLEW